MNSPKVLLLGSITLATLTVGLLAQEQIINEKQAESLLKEFAGNKRFNGLFIPRDYNPKSSVISATAYSKSVKLAAGTEVVDLQQFPFTKVQAYIEGLKKEVIGNSVVKAYRIGQYDVTLRGDGLVQFGCTPVRPTTLKTLIEHLTKVKTSKPKGAKVAQIDNSGTAIVHAVQLDVSTYEQESIRAVLHALNSFVTYGAEPADLNDVDVFSELMEKGTFDTYLYESFNELDGVLSDGVNSEELLINIDNEGSIYMVLLADYEVEVDGSTSDVTYDNFSLALVSDIEELKADLAIPDLLVPKFTKKDIIAVNKQPVDKLYNVFYDFLINADRALTDLEDTLAENCPHNNSVSYSVGDYNVILYADGSVEVEGDSSKIPQSSYLPLLKDWASQQKYKLPAQITSK